MRRFTQVDVFTDELTFGNPVAVVHDADDLTRKTWPTSPAGPI